MSFEILKFEVPGGSAGTSREFCTRLKDAYIEPISATVNNKIQSNYVNVWHDNMKVVAGIDKQLQIQGSPGTIYDPKSLNDSVVYDEYVDDSICFIHDEAGINYQHFFFCFFGRFYYFDELRKTQKIKLGILEDFYTDVGNSTFIKEWINLCYGKDVEIVVLKKNIRYKIRDLILPNAFYCFPQPSGYRHIVDMIRKVVDKVKPFEGPSKKGVYISRQDTIKRGWYHGREMKNELELIELIKTELGFDIIELMDYNMGDKIRIFKSYKNIIQQHSASTTNILFSNPKTYHFLIENPQQNWWLTPKCEEWSTMTNSRLIKISGQGELLESEMDPNSLDRNNIPWRLNNVESIVDSIKQYIG